MPTDYDHQPAGESERANRFLPRSYTGSRGALVRTALLALMTAAIGFGCRGAEIVGVPDVAPAQGALDVPPVIGAFEGVVLEDDDQYYLYGWTCQETVAESLGIHVYVGASAYANPQGQYVLTGSANLMAEDEKVTQCLSAGRNYRFRVALPESLLAAHQGKRIYVHGLRYISWTRNTELIGSGDYVVPAPLSQRPRGCMMATRRPEDSQSTVSAYVTQFEEGQGDLDRWTYVAWIWREPADGEAAAELAHSLSVMRSHDLVTWYNTCGEQVTLPARPSSRTVLDPIPIEHGLFNHQLGYDLAGRPIVTYQKYKRVFSTTAPPVETTQVYNARFIGGQWRISQMTNWTTKDEISGGGTLESQSDDIHFTAPLPSSDGVTLYQQLTRAETDTVGQPYFLGRKRWVIHEGTAQDLSVWDSAGVGTGFTSDPDPMLTATGYYDPPEFHRDFRDDRLPGVTVIPPRRRIIAATDDRRWVEVRADWDSDGYPEPALFDRRMSQFHIWNDPANPVVFQYGPRERPSWPIVGNWGGGAMGPGFASIGIYAWWTNTYYLRWTASGGAADEEHYGAFPSSTYDIWDGPELYGATIPSGTSFLTIDMFPSDGDTGYHCNGAPRVLPPGQPVPPVDENCASNFWSQLWLHEYDEVTETWSKEPVGSYRPEYPDAGWAWAGAIGASPVLVVFKGIKIVAFYDAYRYLTVAIKRPGDDWVYQRLYSSSGYPNQFSGWDNHNYITLAVDERNHDIHVSGNLHNHPLTYWRSTGLYAGTFGWSQTAMVNAATEQEAAYPSWFRGPDGALMFRYRNGGSGDGVWYVNRYNPVTRTWSAHPSTAVFGSERW